MTVLRRSDLDVDPLAQLRRWWREAERLLPYANEAALATATPDGRPSVRMVLVKQVDERGLAFFTNRGSRKGRELAANPCAALLLYWSPTGGAGPPVPARQVRIEGGVEQVGDAECDAYWATRSPASRRSAAASPQSTPLSGRDELERAVAALAARHGDDPPRPPWWGGYRLVPDTWEFWQHGADRLHDRFRYDRDGDAWRVTRLGP